MAAEDRAQYFRKDALTSWFSSYGWKALKSQSEGDVSGGRRSLWKHRHWSKRVSTNDDEHSLKWRGVRSCPTLKLLDPSSAVRRALTNEWSKRFFVIKRKGTVSPIAGKLWRRNLQRSRFHIQIAQEGKKDFDHLLVAAENCANFVTTVCRNCEWYRHPCI